MRYDPSPERFWAKVDKTGECWEWLALRRNGYGRYRVSRGPLVSAHRYAYELVVGPIPAGHELDHLCRNPGCVRPDHLEPVTHQENTRRSPIMGGAGKTHCKHGHEFTPENTYLRPHGAGRSCITCKRAS